MNTRIGAIEQRHLIGLSKLFAFTRLVATIGARLLFDMLRGRLRVTRSLVWLRRLWLLVLTLRHNKVIAINGTYKFQVYLPAFPTPAFYHALRKYDPATKRPGPLSVVLSMTKACSYHCPHCYQRRDYGQEVDVGLLRGVVREMQDLGVCTFDIEGGEPMLRFERLCELLSGFDERAEIWVNTTGNGLTLEKARKMRELGVFGVYVSIHSADAATYDAFTGVPGSFDTAIAAVRTLHAVGIATAINYCASPGDVRENRVEALFDLACELRSAFVQVIHGKPAGAWLEKQGGWVDADDQLDRLRELHRTYNSLSRFRNYPCAAIQVFEEQASVFGCTAGGVERFYLNHAGEVQPCEFLNVSFGNVKDEPFMDIYKRMRSYFPVPGQNWLCCTEAASIAEGIRNQDPPKTPLLSLHTEQLVPQWKPGEPTRLYRKLGIYPNVEGKVSR
jgi:MoaA/NifB/PqqE/SkfB family radical SAM enzyme